MSVEKFIRKELISSTPQSSTRVRIVDAPNTISLAAGDPSFKLPKYVADAVYKAIKDGYTHYCFGGDPDFKLAISNYYEKQYGYKADPEKQIVVTSGGSGSIFAGYGAILNQGDEVIALDPAYGGGSMAPAYFGAKTVFASMEKKPGGVFRFNESALKAAITPKTKALYIENPGNPSGIVYTKNELKAIADLAVDHDFEVLSDETYSEYIWGRRKHSTLIDIPGMEERTIVAMALTKMFAWAGMRTGWTIAGPKLTAYINRVPGSGASWPIMKGAIAALNGPRDFIEGEKKEYEERLDYGVKRLNEIPGIKCVKPEGAFYLFPDITGTGLTSDDFVRGLMEKQHIRIASGRGYGVGNGEGNVRLSMIRPLSTQKMPGWFKVTKRTCFEAAMDRIEKFVRTQKPKKK